MAGERPSSDAQQAWHELCSSAPEVAASPEKQTADEDEKQVAIGTAAEVILQESFPEAIGGDDEKQVVCETIRPAKPEKRSAVLVQWKRDHTVTWWLLVVIVVVVMIAVALGAGLGSALNRRSGQSGKSSPNGATTYYDASPISSPTGTSPPTGTFALGLGMPQETQADCLPQNQRSAWSCNLTPNYELSIIVGSRLGIAAGVASNQPLGASISYAGQSTNLTDFGPWAPQMNTTFALFSTVVDSDYPQSGPAFYFQQYYDKVVVITESAINDTATATKTGVGDERGNRAGHKRDGLISPGVKPWVCVFNSTLIEGFIYINKSSTATTATSSAATATSSASWDALSKYPLDIKIEERRVPYSTVQPYCQQYQVLSNSEANFLTDSNGNAIIVELQESDPDYAAYQSAGVAGGSSSKRDVAGVCRCQWASGGAV